MAVWTYVNASIRFETRSPDKSISKKDLGIIRRHGSNRKPLIPCGSEGGLEYKIIKPHNKKTKTQHTLVITGDLRHYDDVNEILQYFEKITKGKWILSGILEINISTERVFVYRYASGAWVSV